MVMAGPCAVEGESRSSISPTTRGPGCHGSRGGAYKPRTSPYSFQGLGLKGLEFLAKAREATGLMIVTEALDAEGADVVAEYADIIQIGARNMQNYPLLRRAGQLGKPVLLKRGMSATIDELLLAAEYLLAEGNGDVILCERGVRSFDTHTRNLLDLSAIPVVKGLSHLPIIADPSHGTGIRSKVTPMARAAVAAGADGLMVEVHQDPEGPCRTGPSRSIPSSSPCSWSRSGSSPRPSAGSHPPLPERSARLASRSVPSVHSRGHRGLGTLEMDTTDWSHGPRALGRWGRRRPSASCRPGAGPSRPELPLWAPGGGPRRPGGGSWSSWR